MADWSHCKLAGSGLPLLGLPRRAAGTLGAVAGSTAPPLAAGSPGPRGVGRPLWPGFLVCGRPGWPPSSGLDVFLGNFGALGLRAGSALTSSREGPPWAVRGQRPRCAGQKGCRVRGRPRTPLLQGSGLLIVGLPTLGGAQVSAGCQAPGALLAACVPRPPLTFVKKAHPLPGPASAPCPRPEPLPPTL